MTKRRGSGGRRLSTGRRLTDGPGPGADPMSIELRSVSKQFGGVTAVHQVSFSVRDGELMALLGPSGGGKTTVLRMIAGLELPTAGDVLIRGERVNDVPVQRRNIGFVFQNYALFKNMTVARNVAFGLRIKKWRRADIRDRVAELLELFGLEGLDRRYTCDLGPRRRYRNPPDCPLAARYYGAWRIAARPFASGRYCADHSGTRGRATTTNLERSTSANTAR